MKTPVAFFVGLVACVLSAAAAVVIAEQIDTAPATRRGSGDKDARIAELARRVDALAQRMDHTPGETPGSVDLSDLEARATALADRLEKLAAALDERRAKLQSAAERNAALVRDLSPGKAKEEAPETPAVDSEQAIRELARKAAQEARRQARREESRRRMESMRPMFESMMTRRVDSLAERANLTPVQKEKIKGIYLTYGEQFMQTGLRRRELTTEDMTEDQRQAIAEQTRAEFESLRKAQEAEIATTLDDEQFAIYKEWQQESGGRFGRGPSRPGRDN